MKQFKYHPDNQIIISDGADKYIDSIDRFTYDCAKTDLPLLPQKPDNIREYLASPDEASFAIRGNNTQLPFSATGHQPEDFYIYIDNINLLIQAQEERQKKNANLIQSEGEK